MELPPYIQATVAPDSRVYFFSDAHLESENTAQTAERVERVAGFLEYLHSRADVLVILGDLFDFYFEYKTVLPARHLRVLAGIEALSRSGVSCYYAAGNHDFWLGQLFSSTLGVTLVKDALLLVRQTKPQVRVLAAHGDGLGEGDTGYKILKKILRNRLLIRLFRLVHPDWGYAIARLTSRVSRKYTSRMQASRVAASAETARLLLAANRELDSVILAHTHQPDDCRFEHGRYLNSGDWLTHFSYIIWTAEGFQLKTYLEQ
ncbi:MAG TPA: UDP-2,3-diacylglucosamine diphosphatase [archaeon]|nr:UDP-2,3-diacylglucosamine diphosphatase [archaeon]